MIFLTLSINDDGIYNFETFTVSCTEAVSFGTAFAKIYDNAVIGTDNECSSVFHALTAGILSEGKNVWDCGTCTQAQLRYAVIKAESDGGIFIENSGGNIKLIPFSGSGLPLTSSQENSLLEMLRAETSPGNQNGQIINSSALIKIHRSEVQHKFMRSPDHDCIRINSSNPLIKNILAEITENRKTDHFDKVTFSISSDGTRASAYSCESGFVFYEKLILICCINEFEKGNDLPLPHSFPAIADRLARIFGRKILRYSPNSDKDTDLSAKKISLEYPFLNDGLFLTAQITEIMHEKKCSISDLLSNIPEFTTAVKYINIRNDPEQTIENIKKKSQNDVCYDHDDGRITAKRSKSGKSLILYAESYSTESADEFCINWLIDNGIH